MNEVFAQNYVRVCKWIQIHATKNNATSEAITENLYLLCSTLNVIMSENMSEDHKSEHVKDFSSCLVLKDTNSIKAPRTAILLLAFII